MSEATKKAQKYMDELYEKTFGSKNGKLGSALRSINEHEYLGGATEPRYIPVQNLGEHTHDGIPPQGYGVTNQRHWSRFFKEVLVERSEGGASKDA